MQKNIVDLLIINLFFMLFYWATSMSALHISLNFRERMNSISFISLIVCLDHCVNLWD